LEGPKPGKESASDQSDSTYPSRISAITRADECLFADLESFFIPQREFLNNRRATNLQANSRIPIALPRLAMCARTRFSPTLSGHTSLYVRVQERTVELVYATYS